MEIRHALHYDAPPAEVYAMLGDPVFRTAVCEAMGVAAHDVAVTGTTSGMDVRIDMTQRTTGLPSFARKVVGDTTRVIQSERWVAERGADLEVEIPGRPGHVRGRISLAGNRTGTTETFLGEARIAVPLLGRRIAGLVERLFIEGMDTEQGVGARWLAQRGRT